MIVLRSSTRFPVRSKNRLIKESNTSQQSYPQNTQKEQDTEKQRSWQLCVILRVVFFNDTYATSRLLVVGVDANSPRD